MSARPERYFDKNGKLVIYQYGREQPRQHRDLLRMVPETLVLKNGEPPRIKWHGSRCDRCTSWETCKPEIGAGSASINYCARPARGYHARD